MEISWRSLAVLAALAVRMTAGGMTVAELAAMDRQEAGKNVDVCVTGVVTIAFSWIGLSGVIADPFDPNGPSVYCSGRMPEVPMAEAEGCERLEPGDLLEVEGCSASLIVDPGLVARRMRKIGRIDLPPYPDREYAYLQTKDCYNRRARMTGVVRGIRHRRVNGMDGTVLSLATDGGVVPVSVHDASPSWERFIDEEVTVEGVLLPCITMAWETLYPELEAVGDNPIRLTDPGQRFRRKALAFLRFAGVVAVVPLLLVIAALFIQRRRARALARAVSADRRRIAGELHDTVAQYLSGTKILLTSVRSADADLRPELRETLTAACDMLDRTRLEVRAAINDLRSDDLLMKPLGELLCAYADRLQTMGAVRARAEVRRLSKVRSPESKRDILAIVQEASMNAIRHGGAKDIVIRADEAGGALTVEVSNDGLPFDAETAEGPEQGHYGIAGMRERAARLGGTLAFGSAAGRSTVRLSVITPGGI